MSAKAARILVIDDNPGDLQLTRIAFAESGLPVDLTMAATAAQARELLQHPAPYDLILLDLNLTDASGHDLLAEFKRQPQLRDIPVVIVSTSDYSKDREQARALGAADYIVKPNSFGRFIELLQGLQRLMPHAAG